MPTLHLTDLSVRALKGAVGNQTYWDSTLPAFGVRVGKRTKTWTVIRGRLRERVTIGHYPAMSLTDARKEAKKLLSADETPKTVRKTFLEAKTEFLEQHYVGKGANTKYQVTRCLARHCKSLEALQLVAIDDDNLATVLGKLDDRKSEQLHLFRYLRTFFRWCTRPPRRYLEHSPMEGYAGGQDRRRSRILSDEEIVAVWKAVTGPQEAAVKLMLLWGLRRGETCLLRRSWSFGGVLTIPGWEDDTRVTKNGRTHVVPINPVAETTIPVHNHEYIFPGRRGGHITPRGLSLVVGEVQTRSETSGWTTHDLRRTFRSLAARCGVSKDIAELLMNHTPETLEDIYDQYTYVEEKRAALLKVETLLVALLIEPETVSSP